MSYDDLYLAETLAELESRGCHDPERRLRAFTAIALRPETIVQRKCRAALDLLRAERFEPLAYVPFVFNRNMVREQWRWSRTFWPTPDFCALIDLYCRTGESLYVLLRSEDGDASATERLLAFKGDPRAPDRSPHQLRARLDDLLLRPLTFVHGPDDTRAFLREICLYLSAGERRRILDSLLSGEPSGPLVDEVLAELYARAPEVDLRPAEAAARVRAAIAGSPGCGVDPEWPQQLARGERDDWRELLDALEDGGIEIAVWDQIVLGAVSFVADLPTTPPLAKLQPDRRR